MAGSPNPVTPKLLAVLGYNTGIDRNDTTFKTTFPFEQTPWPGTTQRAGKEVNFTQAQILQPSASGLGISSPGLFFISSPNPVRNNNTITYRVLDNTTNVQIFLVDALGRRVKNIFDARRDPGIFTVQWNASDLAAGVYFIRIMADGQAQNLQKIVKL